MKYRAFGSTGLEISEIVFGAGFVGGILLGDDDAVKREAIRRALAGGINWIDTAPSYGDGRSETALGWLLQEIDETPYLSTKFRIEPDRLDDIAGQISESFEASLGRLQRDGVDLLQLHNQIGPETTDRFLGIDDVLRPGGVADALDGLREQGLIQFIGFTAIGDPDCLLKIVRSGRFDSAQVYYNLLNPSAAYAVPEGWSSPDFAGLIDHCQQAGMAVLNIRVMAAGIIATDVRTGREIPMYDGADVPIEEERARQVLGALGDLQGTRAQAAIRFALDNDKVSGVLIGCTELSHIDEALAAVDMAPLSNEAMENLRRLYASNFGRP